MSVVSFTHWPTISVPSCKGPTRPKEVADWSLTGLHTRLILFLAGSACITPAPSPPNALGFRSVAICSLASSQPSSDYVHLRLPHENDRDKTSKNAALQACLSGHPMG